MAPPAVSLTGRFRIGHILRRALVDRLIVVAFFQVAVTAASAVESLPPSGWKYVDDGVVSRSSGLWCSGATLPGVDIQPVSPDGRSCRYVVSCAKCIPNTYYIDVVSTSGKPKRVSSLGWFYNSRSIILLSGGIFADFGPRKGAFKHSASYIIPYKCGVVTISATNRLADSRTLSKFTRFYVARTRAHEFEMFCQGVE